MSLLLQHEIQSSAWQKVSEHIGTRISALRIKNDGELSDLETATLRGQIRELKNLLAQVAPPPVLTTEDDE